MPRSVAAILVFLLGLAVGSFLNVVRYRLPRKADLVRGRSACPNCGHRIAWYDNVPVVSFIALRRRCRACGWKIPWIYPVIEAATAVSFLLVWLRVPPRATPPCFVLAALAIAAAGIDFDLRIIPDAITIPGIAIGLGFSLALPGEATLGRSLLASVLGAAVGGGTLLVIALGYKYLRKMEGMGGGDVKLLAMVGAFLGWKLALLTIFLGALAGGIIGVGIAARSPKGMKTAVPFGVFLSPAAIVAMLWGSDLVARYLSLVWR
jgi:leader peptidase (prepilin peptidase) / N-methyltransferase